MIFDKSRKPNGKDKVFFIDASSEFEQNTNQNTLRTQDIDKIVDSFQKRKTIDKYSYLASYAEIEENEFNLNIPRYVDTFEEEEEIDIAVVQKEIGQIERELAKTQEKMSRYLKELGFWICHSLCGSFPIHPWENKNPNWGSLWIKNRWFARRAQRKPLQVLIPLVENILIISRKGENVKH